MYLSIVEYDAGGLIRKEPDLDAEGLADVPKGGHLDEGAANAAVEAGDERPVVLRGRSGDRRRVGKGDGEERRVECCINTNYFLVLLHRDHERELTLFLTPLSLPSLGTPARDLLRVDGDALSPSGGARVAPIASTRISAGASRLASVAAVSENADALEARGTCRREACTAVEAWTVVKDGVRNKVYLYFRLKLFSHLASHVEAACCISVAPPPHSFSPCLRTDSGSSDDWIFTSLYPSLNRLMHPLKANVSDRRPRLSRTRWTGRRAMPPTKTGPPPRSSERTPP